MVLITIVMSASLNAISFGNRKVTRIAIVLAILAVISGWLEALYHSNQLEIVSDSLDAGLYIYIATYLFRGIIVEKEITMDQLFAAVVIYILIGLTWGNFYSMTDSISPGAIDFGSPSDQSDISNNYMFFSFVTLTTLGYGDMLPVSPFAKSLAILESVTGVMFVAILISRLVGKINTQE